MQKNRLFCLLLALLCTSISCGEAVVTNPTETGETSVAETSDTLADSLPEVDLGGYTFNAFSTLRSWFHGQWDATEENGDTLNDAIYKRNRQVEDRFNCTIINTATEGGITDAVNTVLAGDDTYNMLCLNGGDALSNAQNGLFVNFDKLPYVDLSKPWWPDSINDTLSVGGKLYYAAGSASLACYDYVHVLLFNKQVQKDNKIEDPYALVKSGKWTYDTFNRLAKSVTRDLNGDSKLDSSDLWGFVSGAKQVLPDFWIAANVQTITKDKNDQLVYTLSSNQKFAEVFERIYEITYDNNAWLRNEWTSSTEDSTKLFLEDKALFSDLILGTIERYRSMETDFGALPFPKYDESQDKYYTRIEGSNLICVPVTVGDLEKTSIVLEAINAESERIVTPAYFEIAIKGKYSRDEESLEMLDIICENRIHDLGDTLWCSTLRDGIFAPMFQAGDRNLQSKLASVESNLQEALKKANENFAKLD